MSLKFDSFTQLEGTGAQIIFVPDSSPASKDIIFPLRHLITPPLSG